MKTIKFGAIIIISALFLNNTSQCLTQEDVAVIGTIGTIGVILSPVIIPLAVNTGIATGVGTLVAHYYNKWPLRYMKEIKNEYIIDHNRILLPEDLTSIKNSAVIWRDAIRAYNEDTKRRTTIDEILPVIRYEGNDIFGSNIWNTLECVLHTNNRGQITLLLSKAIDQIKLMHGITKYAPFGWYRKSRESLGNILNRTKGALRYIYYAPGYFSKDYPQRPSLDLPAMMNR